VLHRPVETARVFGKFGQGEPTVRQNKTGDQSFRKKQPPATNALSNWLNGRGGGIRTPDPLLPKQMRYQTALRPDAFSLSHRGCRAPQNVRDILWMSVPKRVCIRLPKIHVSRSMGSRIRAASTRQRVPRKSQLCTVCFRGSSTLPTSRA
jgi:hypothetical protein